MIGLLQRVTQAKVDVGSQTVGAINHGLLVLVGVEKDDTEANASRLIERLLGYRVFADDQGKMNLSLKNIDGGLLLVPQFTLVADTSKGMRPSFSSAARPETGKAMFDLLVSLAKKKHENVETGQFGSDMQVTLTNNGPVTFTIKT